MRQQNSEIIMYRSEDGSTNIDVRMEGETVWLSLDQMADLFSRDKSTISRHIKNILTEGEVLEDSVVANFATTAAERDDLSAIKQVQKKITRSAEKEGKE